jgi:acyl carrier protein
LSQARPPAAIQRLVSVQSAVTAIWRDLLGVQEVGLDDAFFEIGGDSLRVGIMRDRIRREIGAEISSATLLDLPTVRMIAAHVVAAERDQATAAGRFHG